MSDSGRILVTPDDRGPVLNVVAWVSMTCMVLTVLTTLSTKRVRTGQTTVDDICTILSATLAIAQVILVNQQVDAGLGRHMPTIEEERFGKLQYSSDLLYILSVFLSQLSVQLFPLNLARNAEKKVPIKLCMAASGVWITVSLFCLLFRCNTPEMWNTLGDRCIRQETFWDVYSAFVSCIDIFLALLPIFLLWSVQVKATKKVIALLVYACRLSLVPLVVLRAVFIHDAYHSNDVSFNYLKAEILTEVHLHATIILSCVIFLKPVLDGLRLGLWVGDLLATSTNDRSYEGAKGTFHDRLKRMSEARAFAPRASRNQSIQVTTTVELTSMPAPALEQRDSFALGYSLFDGAKGAARKIIVATQGQRS